MMTKLASSGRLEPTRHLLSIADVAMFLGVTTKCVYASWPKWTTNYGLHVVRINGNPHSRPRFWSHEIEAMALAWESLRREPQEVTR